MFLIRLGDKSPMRDGEVSHLRKVWRSPHHPGVFHGEVATADLDVVIFFGGHGAGRFLHVVAEPLVFLHRNLGAASCALIQASFAGE